MLARLVRPVHSGTCPSPARPAGGLLIRMLVAAGHEVTAAANGAEGLAAWRERGADLVLTDMQMPEMNGIEVILQLRAFAPPVPVIAMSGGDRSRDLDLLGDLRRARPGRAVTPARLPGAPRGSKARASRRAGHTGMLSPVRRASPRPGR
jgi:CheY-like chemotaxis protein